MKPLNISSRIFLLATLLLPTHSNATDYGNGVENFAPAQHLNNKDDKYNYWLGIGLYTSPGLGYCTAFLIDTYSTQSSDPAYALTSAHCVNRKNGIMRVDDPIEGSITFNYFADTKDDYKTFQLKRVTWSSIQGVDLALLELETTQGELRAQGISPLKLARQAPAEDSNILLVHAAGTSPLKVSACTHKPSSALFEKPWVWRHSVNNQCKGIKPGSSGSPVLIRETNEAYAVLGTRALDLTPMAGYDLVPDSAYGSPTSVFNSCFIEGKLNTDPNTCELFPAASITLPSKIADHAKISISSEGKLVYPEWNFTPTADTRFIRYKRVYDPVDCETPENYSSPASTSYAHLNVSIGPQSGLNNLCIVGTNSTDKVLPAGTYRNAVTVPTYLHAAGPTPAPALDFVFDKARNRVSIEWPKRKSEGIERYQAKSGSAENVSCEDPQGYTDITFNWWRRESNFPMKLCTYAYDSNNQRSPLSEYTLEWEALKDTAP